MSDNSVATTGGSSTDSIIGVIAWLWVLIPFLWGIYELVIKVVPLFSGG